MTRIINLRPSPSPSFLYVKKYNYSLFACTERNRRSKLHSIRFFPPLFSRDSMCFVPIRCDEPSNVWNDLIFIFMIDIKIKPLNEAVLELVCLREGQVDVSRFYCRGVRSASVTRVNYSLYIKTHHSPSCWGAICFTRKNSCLGSPFYCPP